MLHTTNKSVHFLNHTYIYIYFIIEIVFYRNAVFMIFTQSNMGCVVHKCLREHAKNKFIISILFFKERYIIYLEIDALIWTYAYLTMSTLEAKTL